MQDTQMLASWKDLVLVAVTFNFFPPRHFRCLHTLTQIIFPMELIKPLTIQYRHVPLPVLFSSLLSSLYSKPSFSCFFQFPLHNFSYVSWVNEPWDDPCWHTYFHFLLTCLWAKPNDQSVINVIIPKPITLTQYKWLVVQIISDFPNTQNKHTMVEDRKCSFKTKQKRYSLLFLFCSLYFTTVNWALAGEVYWPTIRIFMKAFSSSSSDLEDE